MLPMGLERFCIPTICQLHQAITGGQHFPNDRLLESILRSGELTYVSPEGVFGMVGESVGEGD